jgi:hypothetical protein
VKVVLAEIYIGDRSRDLADPATQKYIREELAPSMKENGQITAITVRPPNDEDKTQSDYTGQPWVLVAGGCRIAAAILNGWSELEALNRADPIDSIKHLILEVEENLRRKAMNWDEEAKSRKKLLELRKELDPTITAAQVARSIGESAANFSRAVTVAKAIEEDPHLVKAGSVKSALRVKSLADEFKGKMARSVEDSKMVQHLDIESRIVQADLRDWLRARPDASADLSFADFPWGAEFWRQGYKLKPASQRNASKSLAISQYDDSPELAFDLTTDAIPHLVRTTRLSGWIVLFGNQDFYEFQRELVKDCCAVHFDYRENRTDRHCMSAPKQDAMVSSCRFLIPEPTAWIWHRPNSQNNPRYPNLHAKTYVEYILVVNRGSAQLNLPPGQSSVPNILVHDAEYGSDRFHSNQKPVGLYAEIVERCSPVGGIVTDCCAGSFASVAAAASKARYFWACDKNPALIAPGRGFVARHVVPMGGVAEQRNRPEPGELPVEALADTTELPPAPAIRERKFTLAELEYVGEDVLHINDNGTSYFSAYVKNAARRVYQIKGRNRGEVEAMVFDFTARLNELVESGEVDPETAAWEDIDGWVKQDEQLWAACHFGDPEQEVEALAKLGGTDAA